MCRTVPPAQISAKSTCDCYSHLAEQGWPLPIWLRGPSTTTVGVLVCRAGPQHNRLQGLAVTAVGMQASGAGLWHGLPQDLAMTVVGILLSGGWAPGQGCIGGAPLPAENACQK